MADRIVTRKLLLSPVDILSFRGGRSFGPAQQAESELPSPQTLAGAIRTFLLKAHGVNLKEFGNKVKKYGSFDTVLSEYGDPIKGLIDMTVQGPWFRLNKKLLVSVPSNLRTVSSRNGTQTVHNIFRLDPLRNLPPDWKPREPGLHPLWYYGRKSLKSVSGYLTLAGLRNFLEGGVPDSQDMISEKELFGIDRRVGIGVNAIRKTVEEGMIYTAGMLALKRHVDFCAQVTGSYNLIEPICQGKVLMKFGGEGRYVTVSAHKESLWPDVKTGGGDGDVLLLTTPACFNGWRPPNIQCMAASVSHPRGISGWDLAQGGPKPNRFMVPAGTVYFLPKGTHIPHSLVERDDQLVGWGHYLKGTWNYV